MQVQMYAFIKQYAGNKNLQKCGTQHKTCKCQAISKQNRLVKPKPQTKGQKQSQNKQDTQH